MEDKVQTALKVAEELNMINKINPEEIEELVHKFDIKDRDIERVIRTSVYIKARFIYKKSRVDAFKEAFPNRVDKRMKRSTIETKAQRVEDYKEYKYLVSIMSSTNYIMYAFDRMRVLDFTLEKIFDEKTRERERVEYVKTFLQETRKDDDSKKMEVNIDLKQNNVSITQIEDKLNEISNKLEGVTANEILEITNGN